MSSVSVPGGGGKAVAAGWIALALLLALLAASDAASAEYHGLPGRGQWFAIGMALSCLFAALLALAGAPVAGFLTLTLFLGGIAQLWLTESDWFSAVVFVPRSVPDYAMLGIIALEALVALAALWRLFGTRLLPEAARTFGAVRPVLLLALVTIAGVSLFRYVFTGDLVGYAVKLVLIGALTGIHLCALVALLAAPDLPRLGSAVRGSARSPIGPALSFAFLALILSAALALLGFHALGAVEDETAYLFQARTFAAGMLMAPPLPDGLAAAFEYYLLDSTEAGWFATTSPGWPAVLALGVFAGVPWLVNPLLGGLAVFLAHRFVERCVDRWTANLVAQLMASSPWLLGMSASLMTHALSLALIAGAWLSIVVARERFDGGERAAAGCLALLAGLLLGWLFLTRALEGVIIGGLTGLWLVWTLRIRGWPVIALYALGCILTGALLFAYNARFTGDPLVMPLTAYLDRLWGTGGNDFGFGPDIGPPEGWRNLDLWPGHSPLEGLINTLSALPSLSMELLGWPIGSLVLIIAFLLWGRADGFSRAMAIVAVTVIGVHLFYWFNAVFYVGPRYWYAAALPLFVLSVYGARAVIARLEQAGVTRAQERIVTGIVLMAIFAVMIFLPWRGIEKYAQRVATTHAIAAWVDRRDLNDSLIILPAEAFGNAAILIDPLLRSGAPVFAQDLGPQANQRLIAAFRGRTATMQSCANPQGAAEAVLPDCAAPGQGEGDGEIGQHRGERNERRLRQ